MPLLSLGVIATSLLAACPERDVSRVDPTPDQVDEWNVEVTPNRDLDILFVVDNSGSMAGEQASLAANFPEFVGVLQTIVGGMPNVHIGIVSSNVGAAGQASVPGCAGQGDGGNLLVKAGCTGLTGQYISDVADLGGGRVRNYTGELDTLFSCMAQLGTTGCGFEMHLESMYRALQPGANPGFLRPNAYLAVIIIADEDDCSTAQGAMFGDPTAGVGSALGPRTSFRCFEFGVECDDDPNPRAFGTKTGCRPRTASPYMHDVARYVDYLKSLKSDPRLVIVSGIIGVDDERHTVVVGPDATTPANPAVQKSCFIADPDDPNDGAAPPIRIAEFLRSFPSHTTTSICNRSLGAALNEIALKLKAILYDTCLRRPLADGDPARDGTQPMCSVVEVQDPTSSTREETVLPACDANGTTPPCWRITPDVEHCPRAPDHLAIEVFRGGLSAPSNTFLEAQCVVE